jgi:hypothetical protein
MELEKLGVTKIGKILRVTVNASTLMSVEPDDVFSFTWTFPTQAKEEPKTEPACFSEDVEQACEEYERTSQSTIKFLCPKCGKELCAMPSAEGKRLLLDCPNCRYIWSPSEQPEPTNEEDKFDKANQQCVAILANAGYDSNKVAWIARLLQEHNELIKDVPEGERRTLCPGEDLRDGGKSQPISKDRNNAKPVFPCPRDLIRVTLGNGVELLWEVSAVYLGGLREESVVELVPVGQTPNSYGKTLIPAQLLDCAIATGAVCLYAGPNNPNYNGERE